MMMSLPVAVCGVLLYACACALPAFALPNTVPGTKAEVHVEAITANTLKPSACAGITLTAIVEGSGSFSGTGANELIIGSAGIDTVSAGGGADCVLGGAGGDILQGQGGGDVLRGGPGGDTLDGGFGTDTCDGGPDFDTFISCESQTQ